MVVAADDDEGEMDGFAGEAGGDVVEGGEEVRGEVVGVEDGGASLKRR